MKRLNKEIYVNTNSLFVSAQSLVRLFLNLVTGVFRIASDFLFVFFFLRPTAPKLGNTGRKGVQGPNKNSASQLGKMSAELRKTFLKRPM